jgi:hypothetical protein
MNQKNANIRIRYAKQFGCIHQTGNAQSLLQLSTKASCHEILKWLSGNGSLETFESYYRDDSKSLDTMLQWLKQMREELPVKKENEK